MSDPGRRSEDPREQFLNTDHLVGNIKGRSVRGGVITVISQVLRVVVGLGSTLLLARLLTPEDYGLMAMVVAMTNLVVLFKDMGLSMATIQSKELTHAQVSVLFWVNVGVSALLTLIVALIAPLVAWFYEEPRLLMVTFVLSFNFLISGLSVQHQALLRRLMRFGALGTIQVAAALITSVVGVAAAALGAGYWALVAMNLSFVVVSTIGSWVACRWWPSWPRRTEGLGKLLRFGGNITGFSLVNYFARNLDDVLIGKMWGNTGLGFYTKAYELFTLPLKQINSPVASVAITALSRLQDKPERFRRFYLDALTFVTFLTTPITLYLLVMADDFVVLALGDQWVEVVPIFRALTACGIVQPVLNTTGWLYISTDQTQRMLKWGLFASAFLILAFLVGLPFGVLEMASAYSACIFLLSYPCVHYASHETPVRPADVWRTIWPQGLAAAVAVIPSLAYRLLMPGLWPPWLAVLITLVVTALLYVGITFYVLGMKERFMSFVQVLRKKKAPAPSGDQNDDG